jgi:hypothetical protein
VGNRPPLVCTLNRTILRSVSRFINTNINQFMPTYSEFPSQLCRTVFYLSHPYACYMPLQSCSSFHCNSDIRQTVDALITELLIVQFCPSFSCCYVQIFFFVSCLLKMQVTFVQDVPIGFCISLSVAHMSSLVERVHFTFRF